MLNLTKLITMVLTSLLFILIFFVFVVNPKKTECNIEDGCLNNIFIKNKKTCDYQDKDQCTFPLHQLTNNEFDQAIFLRKQQFDLSKSCGKMKLSLKERMLFSRDCDYLIFSRGENMINYIRGECHPFSNLYRLDNNIPFFNEDEIPLLDRVLNKDTLVKNYGALEVQISSDAKLEQLDCFTDFDRQTF